MHSLSPLEVDTIPKAVTVASHPFESHSTGEQSPSLNQSSLFYPSTIEDACWDSFIKLAFDADTQADWDVEYVPIKNRCDHLILPYPSGDILIRMRVLQLNDASVTLLFEHYGDNGGAAAPCVRTEKTIACVGWFQTRSLPTMWPRPVRDQLNRLEIADTGTPVSRGLRLLYRIRSLLTFLRIR